VAAYRDGLAGRAPAGSRPAPGSRGPRPDRPLWWRHRDIAEYSGIDLFSPRDTATPLAALIVGDIPDTPVMLGL
jgi:hypothetical protein